MSLIFLLIYILGLPVAFVISCVWNRVYSRETFSAWHYDSERANIWFTTILWPFALPGYLAFGAVTTAFDVISNFLFRVISRWAPK